MMDRDPGLPDFESFEWDHEDSFLSSRSGKGFETLYASLPDEPVDDTPPLNQPEALPGAIPVPSSDRPGETQTTGVPQLSQIRPSRAPSGRMARQRGEADVDPVFVYLVLMALSFGSTPLATDNPIERYTLLWTLLGLAGLYWTIANNAGLRISLRMNDLLRGGAWGLALGLPLLLVGTDVLSQTSERIFIGLPSGAVFQSIVFVMGTTETLFFRGMIQENRSWRMTALLSSAWSILMFFPTLDVFEFPMLALIIGTFIVMLSALYSYVRYRHGLASAWICQVMMSLLWLLLPRFLA